VIEHNGSTALHCNAIVSEIDDVDDRASVADATARLMNDS
jgi:hypothetical protein